MKALHREIMLSAAYQSAYEHIDSNEAADPDNRLVWRSNFRRLEIEPLRDSILFVTGTLDERLGGPPQNLNSANSKKRTIYGRASRNPTGMLTLFDYPDPNITNEQRVVTNTPLQGLFLMNSDLVARQAEALMKRLGPEPANDEEQADRIQRTYRILYDRQASPAEVQRGLEFLKKAQVLFDRPDAGAPKPQVQPNSSASPATGGRSYRRRSADDEEAAAPAAKMTPWRQYAQALLSSGEFYYVN